MIRNFASSCLRYLQQENFDSYGDDQLFDVEIFEVGPDDEYDEAAEHTVRCTSDCASCGHCAHCCL